VTFSVQATQRGWTAGSPQQQPDSRKRRGGKVDRNIACSDADLKARVYARRGREWVILPNHMARPSIHPQPQGIEVRRARRRLAQADGFDRRGCTDQAYPQLSQEET
jgi:hypothetical protein